MIEYVTFHAWPWAIVLLVLLAALLALANHYQDHRLPRARAHLDELEAQRATRPSPAPVDVTPVRKAQ